MEYRIWENGAPGFDPTYGQPEPTLTAYPAGEQTRGCVIICPGGAYVMRAEHEGAPIARILQKNGIHAFVLNYRIRPYHYPQILQDVQRAIRYVRYYAEQLHVDPEKIGVLGYSAGGHLAMMALELFDDGMDTGDEIDCKSCRPDAGMLCYPVVTMGKYTHRETHDVFLALHKNDSMMEKRFSGELRVRGDMPPVFIWHTANDAVVPVQNSIQLAAALAAHSVPFELHVFPYGTHGVGLGEGVYNIWQWPELCMRWLALYGF